jgi:ABC-type branched-subunit amino acid transport system permease subunit
MSKTRINYLLSGILTGTVCVFVGAVLYFLLPEPYCRVSGAAFFIGTIAFLTGLRDYCVSS